MTTSQIRAELKAAQAAVARLEHSLIDSLRGLPARFGYKSVDQLIAAVKAASGGGSARSGRKKKSQPAKKRRRAEITAATRASVQKLVKAGKTGLEISKALRISTASVQNIRKALGLTKKTGKKKAAASKPAAAATEAAKPSTT